MTGLLRAAIGFGVIGSAVAAGVLHRSPMIVGLLALSFTALYVVGKVSQWRMLASQSGAGAVAKALLVTLPVQAILAGVFYLIGAGIGALTSKREFAERLEAFDLALAGGLLIVGLAAGLCVHAMETRADVDPQKVLSPAIREVMDEAFELGQQSVAMPVQIFSLARRLTDHPDRSEAIAAMTPFFDDDSAFVRRIAYTALRFMGQPGRDADPAALDGRIISGMSDEAVWVRYDAAWCAGEIAGDDPAFAEALRQMIETAVAAQANRADKTDAAHKALTRARDSLKLVEARLR